MQNKKAFTLVELIITIIILTILAGVGFMALTGYTSKARDSQRVESVKNLGEALKMQLMKTDELPTPDNYTNSYTTIDGVEWKVGTLGVEAVKKLTGLEKLPVDPQTGSGFYYAVSKSGNSFIIKTSLENEMNQGGGKGKAKEFVISNFKICGEGYHNDGGACISDLTCASSEHQEGASCVANIKDCYISNGNGTQTWNGNSWGVCENIDCDTGFNLVNGNCYKILANCEAQNPYKIYGNLEALANNTSKDLSADKTENNGIYTYSTKVTCKDGILKDTGDKKEFKKCENGYNDPNGGSNCINEQQVACTESGAPVNASYIGGNVTITWNGTAWNNPANCEWNCNTNYHENTTHTACQSNTRLCEEITYIGTQTWNGTSWGDCIMTECNPAYMEINGVCEEVGNMELVYDGLVSGDVVELPFHGTVNIKNVDCGTGGTWNEIKNGLTKCTYGAGVKSGDTNIQITAKATGFGNLNTKGIGKLKSVTKVENMGFTNLTYAFEGAVKLESVPNTNWTKDVTNMSAMFSGASKFNQLLNNWDTSKVTDMNYMFFRASSFNQPLNTWNTSEVKNMRGMFYKASSFNNGDIAGASNKPLKFNTSNVSNMLSMFKGAKSFNQSINNFDTSKVIYMNNMFSGATSFNQNLDTFNTSNVTNMSYMFSRASSFNNGDIAGASNKPLKFNTSNVTDISGMFNVANSFNQNLDNFDTSNVTDISWIFAWTKSFNQSLDKFDTSKVTNMSYMFYEAISFNNGDTVGASNKPLKFDTSKVTNMSLMFSEARSFNQPLNTWNTSKVKDMARMFYLAINFNQPLSNWDTSNVITMTYSSYNNTNHIGMFEGATKFNQNLNCWNVAKVTNHIHFNLQSGLENINLPKWGTTGVGNCTRPGTMELVYNGLVSGDVVDLPFRGTVNLQSVDCGTGGTWDGVKNGYTKCTYGAGVNSGDTIIKVDGKATAYGKLYGSLPKTIGKLKAVNSWKNMGFTDLSRAFYRAENLIKVPNDDGTKNVTNMYQMFSFAKNFNQNLDNWDTSKVTNMSFMFNAAHNFNNGDTAGASNKPLKWNTSKVTDMYAMFAEAKVFNQNLDNFDTSNVTSMSSMFEEASNFNNGDTAGVLNKPLKFNTNKVKYMSSMFKKAINFNQNLDTFNTSKVTNMRRMFNQASSFNNGDIAGVSNKPLKFNTSNVIDMNSIYDGMFEEATNFNQNLDTFDTSKVTNMRRMFNQASSFNNGDIAGASNKPLKWNTSKVTDMYAMFEEATNFNQNLDTFDTSNVTSMSAMFHNASSFNQNLDHFVLNSKLYNLGAIFYGASNFNNGDIAGKSNKPFNWDTSNVTNMGAMFRGTFSFNQKFGLRFKTDKVTNMGSMFFGATGFNQNLDTFNTSNVIYMAFMFYNSAFNNGDIAGASNKPLKFNTSKVIRMDSMFDGAGSFNQSLTSFDTSNVIDMRFMFYRARSFNQNLDNFDTSKITNMQDMFNLTDKFNNGDIAGASNKPFNWDTSNVTNMDSMFNRAYVFNQKFGPKFKTDKVTSMNAMFYDARRFNQPLSSWNTSNVIKMGQGVSTIGNSNFAGMFESADSFNQNLNCWNVAKVTDYVNFNKNSGLSSTNLPKWGTTGTGTCQ